MTTASRPKTRPRINWAPYLLILPSLLYLALFFGWPMVQGLILAVREEGALLTLHSEAELNSTIAGQLPRGMQVGILDRQGNPIPSGEEGQSNLLTEVWFQVRGEDTEGQSIEGWRQNDVSGCANQMQAARRSLALSDRSWPAAPIHSPVFTRKRTKAAKSWAKWRLELLSKSLLRPR